MDDDGLPLIGTGLDFTKIGAIQQKRTLAFLNHFITHTAGFLNRFSTVCEEKLSALSLRITRLETTISILEAKLNSVPGLENVTVASASSTSVEAAPAPSDPNPPAKTESTPQTAAAPATAHTEIPVETPQLESDVAQNNLPTVKQDPRYAKFFKMLNIGVPENAVKQKMTIEGLNAALLDTPDAPMPDAGNVDNDSDDFSDDGNRSDSSADFSD